MGTGQPHQTPAHVTSGTVSVSFDNRGTAAAVFHVYDRLRLSEVPRRYTVAPGKLLLGSWAVSSAGIYDLWILGPNGFHRHLAGNTAGLAAATVANPDVQVGSNRLSGDLLVKLSNTGNAPCAFQLLANHYAPAGSVSSYTVLARSDKALRLPLVGRGRWYDFSAKVANQAGFGRRFAGRVETGAPSVSDPAISGAARADPWVV